MKSRIFCAVFVLALLATSGCATGRKSASSENAATPARPAQVYGPAAPYGPQPPLPQPLYGPEPIQQRPVVLVLGPGLARGYAYAGVIRALSDAKIRIGAVFGTEMGALIGALYAMDGSVNHMEWGVQRFRSDVFQPDQSMLSHWLKSDPAEKFNASLERVFGDRDLSQAQIPIRILAQPAGEPVKVFDKGAFRMLIRASFGAVNGFAPIDVEGIPTATAGAIRPFDVNDAKALAIGPVIAVDVLDPKESDLYPELKDADLVIRPEVTGIAKTDFGRRTELTFAGKAAINDHLDEIRKLVGGGMP